MHVVRRCMGSVKTRSGSCKKCDSLGPVHDHACVQLTASERVDLLTYNNTLVMANAISKIPGVFRSTQVRCGPVLDPLHACTCICTVHRQLSFNGLPCRELHRDPNKLI